MSFLENQLDRTVEEVRKLEMKNEELEQHNKWYREVMIKLQDFVKRGEDECNIKQLIMKLTDEAMESEIE